MATIIPDTGEAEVGGLLEPIKARLGNIAQLHL
jgi:hypothetical protein